MNLKTIILFTAIIFLTITGCKKSGSPSAKTSSQTETDVYVVGYRYSSTGHYVATLWKNGKPTRLADSSSNSIAYKIIVSGANTYITGYTSDAEGNQIEQCWINGAASAFHNGGPAIAVEGNDVYRTGGYNLGSGFFVPVYWKNGVLETLVDLTGHGGAGNANAIAVKGSDVYVGGYEQGYAAYWKNNMAIPIDNDQSGSQVLAINLQGSDVYLLGYLGLQAAYWKNGVATRLIDTGTVKDAIQSSVQDIAVKGQDVYIAGKITSTDRYSKLENYDAAVYWKNGIATRLTTGLHGEADAILIQGDDIYIAGEDNPDNFFGTIATYWKNGTPVTLERGIAYGITIVQH